MPIYEYQCNQCGTFEHSQRITDKPIKSCPKCGSAVRRVISRTSFVLKGSGWYVTDYGRNGSRQGDSSSTVDTKSTSAADLPKTPSTVGESATKSTDKTPATGGNAAPS
jgi:putative FmdB family regulatory protein